MKKENFKRAQEIQNETIKIDEVLKQIDYIQSKEPNQEYPFVETIKLYGECISVSPYYNHHKKIAKNCTNVFLIMYKAELERLRQELQIEFEKL